MTTKLPRLLLMGAMLSPTTLYALGLGEIRLNSALNQPFDAEIELISPTSEELQNLQVGLASADAFSRYGVDRPAFLSDFRFRVTRADDGRSVLRVTSGTTVTEPFVTFIVEADWPSGRLLREYTVLLDPPVYMPGETQAAAPVATPRSGARPEGTIQRPRETAAPAPRPAAPRAPAPAPAASAPSAYAGGGTYTVQRNDTLWRIASQVRPGSTRVVNQTMMAIYRANPQAFDGNINLLRSGAVLQIPDAASIDSISASEASREVSAQYAAWRGDAEPAADSGRLRLVAPEEPARPAQATSAQAQPSAPASSDPALRSRVDQLESELAEARRLLELRNAELAEMQSRLSESGTEAAVEPELLPAPEGGEGAVETPAESEPVAAETPAPAVEPAAEPARPATPPPVVRPPEPSLLERIGSFWWALVVLGLAVLAGLLMYFRKRRQPDIDDALDTLGPQDFSARRAQGAAGRRQADALIVEESDDDFDVRDAKTATSLRTATAGAAAAAAAARGATEAIGSDSSTIDLDQQDALAEADFHMAYGLYDQAADLVKLAIDREPARRDLKLKLLEIYFVWGNKDMFLDTARELEASRAGAEPGEWDKVLIMGKQICPDEPMFAGAMSGDGARGTVDLNLEGGENRVDIDLFGAPTDGDGAAGLDLQFDDIEAQPDQRRTDDTGIDFLLDEPQRGGTDFDFGADTAARTQETPTVENRAIDSGDRLARTQETPTVENPALDYDSGPETAELDDGTGTQRLGIEQTAEVAIDDLGIDVGSYAETEDGDLESIDIGDESTGERQGLDGTGTVLLDQDLLTSSTASTAEHPELDISASGVDFDFESLEQEGQVKVDSTAEWATGSLAEDGLSSNDDDGFDLATTAETPSPNIGGTRTLEAPDLSELEPVTMSEVGTKLDLARAYVDMGDPDGARSILEEVLHEGSATQKEEAQRLLESIA